MIKIIRHKNPIKVCDCGDILSPFKNWESTSTGAGFFSKPDKSFYGEKKFLPLRAISAKIWTALEALDIKFDTLKKSLSYECPYTEYTHYSAVPIYLFSDDIDDIIDNTKAIYWKDMYKDHEWMVDMEFPKDSKEFHISSINESFMGPGYTHGTRPCDGHGRRFDALIALDNGGYLGCKVWVWYNK